MFCSMRKSQALNGRFTKPFGQSLNGEFAELVGVVLDHKCRQKLRFPMSDATIRKAKLSLHSKRGIDAVIGNCAISDTVPM